MQDLRNEVTNIMTSICDSTAKAIHRYAEVSRKDPGDDMAESFMASAAFNDLGSKFVITMETSRRKIMDYIEKSPQSHDGKIMNHIRNALMTRPQRRFDLVIYRNYNSQDCYMPLCVVEFKRHKYDAADKDKIQEILDISHVCPFGALVWCHNKWDDDNFFARKKKEVEKVGGIWIVKKVKHIANNITHYDYSACCCIYPAGGTVT